MTDYWKDVDTVLMGRKTYEFSVAHQSPPKRKKALSSKREYRSKKVPAVRTYVFSRTLKKLDSPASELISSDAAEFLRALKQQSGKGICLLGGGELAQSLMAADLVDEVRLNIHPVLLGAGIPTFHNAGHRVKLAMTECRTMKGDCVLVSYRVLPKSNGACTRAEGYFAGSRVPAKLRRRSIEGAPRLQQTL